MQCTNCKKEDPWLEMIGSDLICKRCINKNRVMGIIFRTHIDTFHFVLRKMGPKNYQDFLGITRKEVEKLVNLKKYGIFLKTTNVVELE
ncbi:hypothetical protein KY366_08435 [Candidatus Woesearchaeota archaeon]|nr:hypothetical protein [Candidatus Woesearchaeota archaeon]